MVFASQVACAPEQIITNEGDLARIMDFKSDRIKERHISKTRIKIWPDASPREELDFHH